MGDANIPVCNGQAPSVMPTDCQCDDNRYKLVNTQEGGKTCRVLRCPGGQSCNLSRGACQCPFSCQAAHRGGCIGAGLNGCDLPIERRFTGAKCT
eukprot:Awhi_evm2s634